jgi:hypothetical protein
MYIHGAVTDNTANSGARIYWQLSNFCLSLGRYDTRFDGDTEAIITASI